MSHPWLSISGSTTLSGGEPSSDGENPILGTTDDAGLVPTPGDGVPTLFRDAHFESPPFNAELSPSGSHVPHGNPFLRCCAVAVVVV